MQGVWWKRNICIASESERMMSSDMSEILDVCLTIVKEETGENCRQTVETLLNIFRNAAGHPTEEKYRKLKKDNKTFHGKVWQYDGAQQFMLATGWAEVDESVHLLSDDNLSSAISTLETHHRAFPQPSPALTTSTCTSNMWSSREINERDRTLEGEKRKQQEEYKRLKEERKRITEQIYADRKNVNARETKPSQARKRTKGANIKRFEDIGVDLNKGGG